MRILQRLLNAIRPAPSKGAKKPVAGERDAGDTLPTPSDAEPTADEMSVLRDASVPLSTAGAMGRKATSMPLREVLNRPIAPPAPRSRESTPLGLMIVEEWLKRCMKGGVIDHLSNDQITVAAGIDELPLKPSPPANEACDLPEKLRVEQRLVMSTALPEEKHVGTGAMPEPGALSKAQAWLDGSDRELFEHFPFARHGTRYAAFFSYRIVEPYADRAWRGTPNLAPLLLTNRCGCGGRQCSGWLDREKAAQIARTIEGLSLKAILLDVVQRLNPS